MLPAILKTAAVVCATWLLLPLLLPVREGPFEPGAWQEFHGHFTGGQLGSMAPGGDLTRLLMVDDLLRTHLRVGTPRSRALQLLGKAEAGAGDGRAEEDVYSLVDRPGVVGAVLALRRWGATEPALRVDYQDGVVTEASVQ